MSHNITAIAQQAAESRKPSRDEAMAALCHLANVMDSTMAQGHRDELAKLYRFLTPPAAKRPQTAYAWVTLALAGKNDNRIYLRYVHVTEKHITATDGARIHRCPNYLDLAPGYYDANAVKIEPLEKWKFPDVERVIPDRMNRDYRDTVTKFADLELGQTEGKRLNKSKRETIMFHRLPSADPNHPELGPCVDTLYWDAAMSMLDKDATQAMVSIGPATSPVRVDLPYGMAVIGPMRDTPELAAAHTAKVAKAGRI